MAWRGYFGFAGGTRQVFWREMVREKRITGVWRGEEASALHWPWFAFECTVSLVCTVLSLSQGEERLASGSGSVEFVTWDVALWISDLLFHLGNEMPRVQEGRVCA